MKMPGEETNTNAAMDVMTASAELGKLGEDPAAGAAAGDEPAKTDAGATDEPAPEKAEGTEGAEAGDDKPVKFTAEQQEVFDKRLGKEVAKRKTAEEKAAKLEADLATANAAVDQGTVEAARGLAVAPEYLKTGEAEILKKDEQLTAFEDWAAENAEGYEDGKVTYTAAQIRKRLQEVQREHFRVSMRAETIRERARQEMLEDIREGRKARAAKAAAAEALKNKAPEKQAGAPIEARPAAGAARGKPSPDQVFEKGGKSKQAAADALGMM